MLLSTPREGSLHIGHHPHLADSRCQGASSDYRDTRREEITSLGKEATVRAVISSLAEAPAARRQPPQNDPPARDSETKKRIETSVG